ncbi:MAG: hypothetical protein [Bacteriophage sp.]|nr:MAG: hypothetical protein [Bacteriophage sp.]
MPNSPALFFAPDDAVLNALSAEFFIRSNSFLMGFCFALSSAILRFETSMFPAS